jgi:molybdate transport system substrate-binding protein
VLAEEVRVGCVTNFTAAAEELKRIFEKTSTHTLKLISSSSGKLATMVRETSDLEIALLGELKIAQKLDEEGLVAKNSRFTYAIGKLALWSKRPDFVDHKGEVLQQGQFAHIIIPDVKDTAYGIAAKKVLDDMKLWESIEPKVISAVNVASARDMIAQEKAELGFTALSLLNPNKKIEGSVWILPQKLYPAIEQQAILLKHAENNKAAQAFMTFLKTPVAYNTIEKYSYSLPTH